MQSSNAVYADSGMPVSLAKAGEKGMIVRISGGQGIRKYLNDLGFSVGTEICAVADMKGNKILSVRGSRVAVDSRLASMIMYRPE